MIIKTGNFVRDDKDNILFIDFGESKIRGEESEEEWKQKCEDQRRKFALVVAENLKCIQGTRKAEEEYNMRFSYEERKRKAKERNKDHQKPIEETKNYKDLQKESLRNKTSQTLLSSNWHCRQAHLATRGLFSKLFGHLRTTARWFAARDFLCATCRSHPSRMPRKWRSWWALSVSSFTNTYFELAHFF